MKYLLALLFSLTCAQAIAQTYTLVIKTSIAVPGADEVWNNTPVSLQSMAGEFYVGPFANQTLCKSFEAAGVTGMFAGSTFNMLPITVTVTSKTCHVTSTL
jgi:hypothetical protein